MAVIRSLYDTQNQQTTTTRSGGTVIQPLIPTNSPVLERKKTTVETSQPREETKIESISKKTKGLISKNKVSGWDRIRQDIDNTSNSIKSLFKKETYQKAKQKVEGDVEKTKKTIKEPGKGARAEEIVRKDIEKTASESGTGKGFAKIGVSLLDIVANTADFTVDFVLNNLDDVVVNDVSMLVSPEKAQRRKDEWQKFIDERRKSGKKEYTQRFQEAVDRLSENQYLQPSKEWQEATLGEKLSKEHIGETIFELGAGIIPSMGIYALSAPVGVTAVVLSTANDVKNTLVEYGATEEQAERIGLGAGILVGALDKIVPDEIFGGKPIKDKFMRNFVKRLMARGSLEALTEATQEGVQLIAENTFRDDIGWEEIKTRTVLSALGGFGAGGFFSGVVDMVNGITGSESANVEFKQQTQGQVDTLAGQVESGEITLDQLIDQVNDGRLNQDVFQRVSEKVSGLTLLTQYNEAVEAGDTGKAKFLGQQILESPDDTPIAKYKSLIEKSLADQQPSSVSPLDILNRNVGENVITPDETLEEEKKEITAEQIQEVGTTTLTPDQAITVASTVELKNTDLGKEIMRAVLEAKTLNQNIEVVVEQEGQKPEVRLAGIEEATTGIEEVATEPEPTAREEKEAQTGKEVEPEGVEESIAESEGREVLEVDKHGKNIVSESDGIRYAVNDINNATYITAWDGDSRVATMSTADKAISGADGYIQIGSVVVDPKYRKRGIATELYKVLSKYAKEGTRGIVGYSPDIVNQKAISSIYKKLGGRLDEETGNLYIDFQKKVAEKVQKKPVSRVGESKKKTKQARKPKKVIKKVSRGVAKKPKVSALGTPVKQIPSIKVEKVWRSVTSNGRSSLPILTNVNVKDGKMIMTDLGIWTEVNTNQKDGIYQVMGNDLVPLDPKLADEYPSVPVAGETYGQGLPDDLSKTIKKVSLYSSKDETRPVLASIRLEFGKNKLRVISTDGFRLINKTIGIKGKKEGSVTVGNVKKLNQVFDEVLKGGGVVNLSIDEKEGFITFENGNGKIAVRTVAGDYPNINNVYPETNRKIVVDKKSLDKALKEIAPYAKDNSNTIKLSIEPTNLTINAESKEKIKKTVNVEIKRSIEKEISGSVAGTLIMPVKNDDGRIWMNYKYLQDTLKTLDENDVYISYFLDNKGKIATTQPIPVSDIDEESVSGEPERVFGASIVGGANIETIKIGDDYFIRDEDTKKRLKHYKTEKEARAYVDGLLTEGQKWATLNVEQGKKYWYVKNANGTILVKADNQDVAEAFKWGIFDRKDVVQTKKKAPSGTTQANIDRFADLKNLADREGYYKAIQFPEIVRMVRELLGVIPTVRYPRARKSLGGVPLGFFKGGEGYKAGAEIVLNPDIFKSPEQAVKTFAHEVGHLADWLPDYTHKRGNLIGHIASLNSYLKHTYAGDLKQGAIDSMELRKMDLQEQRRQLKAEGRTGGTKDKQLLEEIKYINKEIKEAKKNAELILDKVQEELKAVTQIWKPFNDEEADESFVRYRYSSPELYADAISVLFNDPQLLKRTAPTFWKGFFDSLDKKPEVKKVYFETMDLLNKGEVAILSERYKEIGNMFKRGEDKHRVKLEEERINKHSITFRLKNELIDKNQRTIDLVNQMKKKGKPLPDEDNPIYFLEDSNYVGGVVKSWLEQNIQPIYADLEANEVSWDDFGQALFLERVIKERGGTRNPIKLIRENNPEIYEGIAEDLPEGIENKTSDEQLAFLKAKYGKALDENGDSRYDEIVAGLPKGLANPLGYDVETAQKQLDYLKQQVGKEKYAVIDRNLSKFRRSIKSLIPQAFEAGLYKKEMADQMIANPAYATFQVIDYMETYIPASIKQQVGTLKEVSNPAGATILKSISTIRAIEKNTAKTKLLDFLKNNYPEEIQSARTIWTGRAKIPIDPKGKGLELVTVMEGGSLKGYYVDSYIAQSIKTMGTGQTNAVLSIFRFMNTKLFKPLFTTFNLGFQTFNLFRDFFRYYKNIPGYNLPKAMQRYAQALPHARKRAWGISDSLIQEMEASKILGITYNDVISGMTDEDRQIDFVLRKYGLSKNEASRRALFKIPLGIMDQIARTGNFMETIPKVAGYKELNGKMPPQEMRSFIRTSVGSPDFLRKGSGYGWYNEIFLFSNAIKEGVRADYNVALKNPRTRGGWMFKTAGLTLLPKIIMFGALAGLFGDELKEMMESATEYDKTNYIIVPLGIDENGKTIYLRIPQDETGRFIGGIFWKILNLTKKESLSTSDVAEIFSYTGGQVPSLSPVITSLFATATFMAGKNPYDFFRGRNVIPDTEFEAGGMYALKPFVTWQINQLGGGIFWKSYYTTQAPETETWLQKVIQAPVVSNIVGRWIRVTDYGQQEKNREIIDEQKKLSAQETIRRRELVDKYVTEYRKDPSNSNRIILENRLIEETLGHDTPQDSDEKRLRTNTLKKFDIGILEGEADANLNSLIDAYTNAQKVEILKSLKSVMDEAEYEELVRTAKDHKIISDDVLDKMSYADTPDNKSVVRSVADLVKKIQLVPEVYASEGEREIDNVYIEGDRVITMYSDGTFTNKELKEEKSKGLLSFFGKALNDVGTRLGLEEKGWSEKLGYKNVDQKRQELIDFSEQLKGVADNFVVQAKEEEKKSKERIKENKDDGAYYKDEKVYVIGSGNDKKPTETQVPDNVAKTIRDVFGDDLALEAIRTLHHPEEFTDIGDEQSRGINKTPNRGENPSFTIYNIDVPNSNGSIDRGLFRINDYGFSEMWNRTFDNGKTYPIRTKMKKLGINSYDDMDDLEKNVRMARLIYDEGGWLRWYASPKDLREK